ncbi:MAG: UDP-N-acetylmuramate dehydrogenase [Campylobacterales bacterium]|nr:UDP-N-acetylmuramate dehydrogenase [Campylobacterales bacterium]
MTKSVNLAHLSSIGIGPVAEVSLLDSIAPAPKGAFLLGACNNLLIAPHTPPLCMLSKTFDFIRLDDDGALHVGAATPGGRVVSFCKKHDLGGFEFLSHLPGTLGGMLKMNAGLKEWEIFNSIIELRTAGGWIPKSAIEHGYRRTAINEAVFEARFTCKGGFSGALIDAFAAMRANQPKNPSAGSCFKNPPGDYAGRLIEAVGLKGVREGAMAFSELHANFLINLGGGTFDEAMRLIRSAETRVFERFGVRLEREIIVVAESESDG